LTDPIGISAAVKDYELGSGKVPEIQLKKPEFDPSKFMTSMVDKTLPEKSGGAGAGHGTFKEDGTVPKPIVPPKKPAPKAAAAKPPKKGAPLRGGKSASPDSKAAREKQSGKIFQSAAKPLAALKAKEALTRSELDRELAKIKGRVSGIEFGVQLKSGKWLVIPKAGGKTAKGVEISAKLSEKEKKGDKKDDRTEKQKLADLEAAIASADALLSAPDAEVEAVRKQLPSIKSKYELSMLDIIIDLEETDDEVVHIHAEINPKRDGPKKKKKKGKPKTSEVAVITKNYEVVWTKDAKGRTVSAKATLKEVFTGATRSSQEVSAQSKSAAKGKVGDVGGHIIGHRFVKDQGIINMFPQNARFNNSAWKTMENEWAAAIKAGHHVVVDIVFGGGTLARPEKVAVSYKFIDVDTGQVKHSASEIFKNDEFQKFSRLSTEEIGAL